jgi:hypothetical protein
MKFVIIALAAILGLSTVAYILYPEDYSEAETESAFATLTKEGFDSATANRLIKQYRISTASFRMHFLATGHMAALKNPHVFDGRYNDQWAVIVKDIVDHGQMAAEDWFSLERYSTMRTQLGYSPVSQ